MSGTVSIGEIGGLVEKAEKLKARLGDVGLLKCNLHYLKHDRANDRRYEMSFRCDGDSTEYTWFPDAEEGEKSPFLVRADGEFATWGEMLRLTRGDVFYIPVRLGESGWMWECYHVYLKAHILGDKDNFVTLYDDEWDMIQPLENDGLRELIKH